MKIRASSFAAPGTPVVVTMTFGDEQRAYTLEANDELTLTVGVWVKHSREVDPGLDLLIEVDPKVKRQ